MDADRIVAPLDVVKAFLAKMAQLDYDAALRFVAEDCEYHNMPMAKLHGHAGIRGMLEPFFAPTLENEFIVLRAAVDGPVVFTERLDRHRLKDKWVELPVTGVWEVHDGLITLWREYFNAATLLDVWPAPGA